MPLLLEEQEKNQDYIKYQYSYEGRMPLKSGHGTVFVPTTCYSWTTDKNHPDLTGKYQVYHYVYQGYNFIEKKYGPFSVIVDAPSSYVDDINDLREEYPYVKKNHTQVIVIEEGYLEDLDASFDYGARQDSENDSFLKSTDVLSNSVSDVFYDSEFKLVKKY